MTPERAIDHLERALLRHMANQANPFGACETFHSIAALTIDPLDRETTRAILRRMADRGLCAFARGLFDDDGMPRGSGYGLTPNGLRIAREEFVLVKNGLFYRPRAQGYTASTAEAGLFTLEDARAHCEAGEGIHARHINTLEEIAPIHTAHPAFTPTMETDT